MRKTGGGKREMNCVQEFLARYGEIPEPDKPVTIVVQEADGEVLARHQCGNPTTRAIVHMMCHAIADIQPTLKCSQESFNLVSWNADSRTLTVRLKSVPVIITESTPGDCQGFTNP